MTALPPVIHPRRNAGDRSLNRRKALHALAEGLCLTATPAFALMALASYLADGSSGMVCGAMGNASFGGMTGMYLLMSAFHLTPWLKLASPGKSPGERVGG